MVFDTARRRVMLFGGAPASGPALADTWEWDGAAWKQVADIGPDGCIRAALVFKLDRSSLFGGISTLVTDPTQRLFGLTWDWNGQHWTERQDIGVGPRFGHAMAFDSARNRVVLFGGLDVAPADPQAASHLKGDTWEQTDTAGSGPPPGQPVDTIPLASMTLAPGTVQPGMDVQITVGLAQAAPAPGDAVALGGQLGALGVIVVPAGQTTRSVTLSIPPGIGNNIVLPAAVTLTATSGGVMMSRLLAIVA